MSIQFIMEQTGASNLITKAGVGRLNKVDGSAGLGKLLGKVGVEPGWGGPTHEHDTGPTVVHESFTANKCEEMRHDWLAKKYRAGGASIAKTASNPERPFPRQRSGTCMPPMGST